MRICRCWFLLVVIVSMVLGSDGDVYDDKKEHINKVYWFILPV